MTIDPGELAIEIESRFTPLAFTCKCGGEHRTCATAMEDRAVYSQYETVQRITRFIRALDGEPA